MSMSSDEHTEQVPKYPDEEKFEYLRRLIDRAEQAAKYRKHRDYEINVSRLGGAVDGLAEYPKGGVDSDE